jgi:hypothetical protein
VLAAAAPSLRAFALVLTLRSRQGSKAVASAEGQKPRQLRLQRHHHHQRPHQPAAPHLIPPETRTSVTARASSSSAGSASTRRIVRVVAARALLVSALDPARRRRLGRPGVDSHRSDRSKGVASILWRKLSIKRKQMVPFMLGNQYGSEPVPCNSWFGSGLV